MKLSSLPFRAVLFSLFATLSTMFAAAEDSPLILILTTPDLSTPPPNYTVLKTLTATTELPSQIHGPLDNPALKNIIEQAKALHASALLGLNCQTNGHNIACSSIALSHNFSTPTTNNFDETVQELFGNHFYTDPLTYPAAPELGRNLSVTFYMNPEQYRTVSGEHVEENKEWWGLKKESLTVQKPEIPALCIDALYFLKALNVEGGGGLINFNCFLSTSTLPGYVQINTSADEVQKN